MPAVTCATAKSTTVTLEIDDVPPAGAGLLTVTLNAPDAAMSAAEMAAVTCVALTKVVVLATPLKFTTVDVLKFVPFTVSVNPAPPFTSLDGEIVVSVGTGLFMVNAEFPDVPPPGAGLVTVTFGVPAAAMSAAVIDAVICVALTNVVAFAAPLKFTTEVETKFVPFTVSVNAAPPAVAVVGAIVVIAGTGLFTAKDCAADGPVVGAGLLTVTLNVPAVAI